MCRPGGAVGPKYWWQAGAERLGELASVLRRDFMIRRLKTDVLPQLPAKRRQVLRLEQPTCKDMEEAEKAALQVWSGLTPRFPHSIVWYMHICITHCRGCHKQ